MNHLRTLLIGALALALGACGGSANQALDEFAAATPDVAGLTLETSGGSAEAAVSPLEAVGAEQSTAAVSTPCQPYEYLCNIHAAVVGLNTYVRAAVAPIEALARTTPTIVSPTVRVYGPVDAPAAPATPVASFRLTVKKGLAWFYWALEGKPLGSADSAYVLVAAGAVRRTAADWAHRGRGYLGIDLDNLFTLNPAGGTPVWPGKGKLLAGFGHLGGAKSLVYVLKDFTADGVASPQNTVLVGWKNAAGVARVRIASLNEFVAPSGGGTDIGNELLLSRAIWLPSLGGRAVVAIGGGDVPSYGYDFFLGISCFNVSENDVYRALYGCTGGTCTVVNVPGYPQFNTGDPALCALGSDLGLSSTHPPTDPLSALTDPAVEPGGPDVTPETPPSSVTNLTTGN
jgi:hypothetical protein